jgi:hypothetical protein
VRPLRSDIPGLTVGQAEEPVNPDPCNRRDNRANYRFRLEICPDYLDKSIYIKHLKADTGSDEQGADYAEQGAQLPYQGGNRGGARRRVSGLHYEYDITILTISQYDDISFENSASTSR